MRFMLGYGTLHSKYQPSLVSTDTVRVRVRVRSSSGRVNWTKFSPTPNDCIVRLSTFFYGNKTSIK